MIITSEWLKKNNACESGIQWFLQNCNNGIECVELCKKLMTAGEWGYNKWLIKKIKIESITIPDGVTTIGGYAFCNCSSLQSIAIPDGVTSIENLAFYGCSSLQSIAIPDGVTEIGDCAFEGCSSLQSIEIPDGVTSIGDLAFYGCSSKIQNYVADFLKRVKL